MLGKRFALKIIVPRLSILFFISVLGMLWSDADVQVTGNHYQSICMQVYAPVSVLDWFIVLGGSTGGMDIHR